MRTTHEEDVLTSGPAVSREQDLPNDRDASHSGGPRAGRLDGTGEVVRVRLSDLREGVTPRLEGEDPSHVRVLADIFEILPPIVVHRESMTVVDGYHRVRAARLLQIAEVSALLFDGDEADAYLESVRLNIAHGKPLTLRERERAATQIAESHPDWSDRRIAELCGVSPKTVARSRKASSEEDPHLTVRIGRDHKRRPTDPAALRLKVAEHLKASPDASLEAVARATGSSRGTVRDVRERLRTHRDVVPQGLKRRRRYSNVRAETDEPTAGQPAASPQPERARTSTATAAELAEWLAATDVRDEHCKAYAAVVPVASIRSIAADARRRAATWNRFADLIEAQAK
jgi:ParB-like chromosome segregation protein Spo0J